MRSHICWLHPLQRCCSDKVFLLLLQYRPARPIILSPNFVSVPKVKQMQTFVHAQAGALHWTPTVVPVCELQVQLFTLCWVQSIIDFRERWHYTMLIFYGNTHQKSWNAKKKELHRLFKHYYYYYHPRHHQSVFIYATNKVWRLPSIGPHPAGAHHGFPPSIEVKRTTNLESGRRRESRERQIFTQSPKKRSSKRFHFPFKGFWWLLKGHFSGRGPSSPRQNQHPQLRKIFQTAVLLRSN